MIKQRKIACVGGDKRQIWCAKKLAEAGYEVALYGFEKELHDIGLCTRCVRVSDATELADTLLLPMPATTDGESVHTPLSDKILPLDRVLKNMMPGALVLYGGICPSLENMAKGCKLRTVNYYNREDYQVANAVPTAEGAIAIALDELPITLNDAVCLVIGYGRIGKVLTKHLCALGAKVYASARKSEDLIWAKIAGASPVFTADIMSVLPECDVVFNTVPKTILDQAHLLKVRKDTLLIDLASKPGGIDFALAKNQGLNAVWALALPGKTAPQTAGRILSETVREILNKEE